MKNFLLVLLFIPIFHASAGTCIDKEYYNKFVLKDCTVEITEIPTLMHNRLWVQAEAFMNHWFEGTGSNYHVKLSDIELINSDLKNELLKISNNASSNNLLTDAMQDALITELKKTNTQFNSGLEGSFNHISTELQLIGEGWKYPVDEKKDLRYFSSQGFGDSDLTAFGAAYGRLTIRLVAAGEFDGEKITVKKIGVYIRDSYDFKGYQILGSWQQDYPYVSYFPSARTTEYTNSSFQIFNEYHGNDADHGDFRIFSDMREMPTNQSFYYADGLTRAQAVRRIIKKFDIPLVSAGFNSYRFGERIIVPSDVTMLTDNRGYIVTAYNKGIVRSNSDKFRPKDRVTFAEFITMTVRAIPIPLDNPKYKSFSYNKGYWYYKYLKAAYNAGIIKNKSYSFDTGIEEEEANQLLERANDYFRGSKSGISIYVKWRKKYADIDLYLFNQSDSSITPKHGSDRVITNMDKVKKSGEIVYWDGKYTTDWGANLDYDSWGGNSQPWSGAGEERVTVDSQMVKRPGIYPVILCYDFDWGDHQPSKVTVEWWGINKGRSINKPDSDGVRRHFKQDVPKGSCLWAGRLNTYK